MCKQLCSLITTVRSPQITWSQPVRRCRVSGPTPGLLNHNLHFDKKPRWLATLKLQKQVLEPLLKMFLNKHNVLGWDKDGPTPHTLTHQAESDYLLVIKGTDPMEILCDFPACVHDIATPSWASEIAWASSLTLMQVLSPLENFHNYLGVCGAQWRFPVQERTLMFGNLL